MLTWGGAVCGLGTPVATHPRGLTSNRHAGRPDRSSIRAFALVRRIRTSDRMPQPPEPRIDPRSPVQPGRSSAPYLLIALVAAVLVWTAQQYWFSGASSSHDAPVQRPQGPALGATASRGDVRTVFTADDYPAIAQEKGQG